MNGVQIGAMEVRHGQISQAQLLATAKRIVAAEGVAALGIRHLAAESGVAIGSIYNYFPSKGDLLAAVIGDFWREAVHGALKQEGEATFEAVVETLYGRLYAYFQTFARDWLAQDSAMSRQERARGKQAEAEYFRHIQEELLAVLVADESIPAAVWNAILTPQALTELVFAHMLLNLRNNSKDCAVLLAILQKLLHP